MEQGKQKICWIIASPLTIRFFLMGHIAALAKDYNLTVITNTSDQGFLSDLGVEVRVIPVAIERDVSLWKDLQALIRLALIFRRENFSLVHTLSPKSALLGITAAWIARVPLRVHIFQGEVWVTRKGLWRVILKTLDKWVAWCSTHLLVVSRSEEAFLVEQGVVPAGRLKLLANGSICGVDVERFKPDSHARQALRAQLGIGDTEQIILYVGRLTRDKGLLDLSRAFSSLAEHYPHVHLLLVGPDEENMRTQVSESCPDVANRLHFSDYTSEPERYMAAADILCLPSYREGFGLVLIEAAAVGIPTIASRIYGITDAVQDKVTGLLFKPGDVEDLSKQIRLLIDDEGLARTLGLNGKERTLRDFRKELVQSALLDFYKQLFTNQESVSDEKSL